MSYQVDWKPNLNLSAIVPKYYKGNVNKSNINQTEYTSAFGSARPMKGYRRQLSGNTLPTNQYFTASKYGVTLSQLEKPGGTVNVGLTTHPNCAQCTVDYSNCIIDSSNGCLQYAGKPSVSFVNLIKGWTVEESFVQGEKFTDISSNIFEQCTSCNPEKNVIKTITRPTRINHDDNYTGYKQFLQSRNKTPATNSTTQKYPGVVYINANTGLPMNPNTLPVGPQTFASYQKTICPNNDPFQVTYKPNNNAFGVEGAVDAGTSIRKRLHDTLSVNGGSYITADGALGANRGQYYNSTNTSNSIKRIFTPSLKFSFTKLQRRYLGSTPCC